MTDKNSKTDTKKVELDDDLFTKKDTENVQLDNAIKVMDKQIDNIKNPEVLTNKDVPPFDQETLKQVKESLDKLTPTERAKFAEMLRNKVEMNNKKFSTVKESTREQALKKVEERRQQLKMMRTSKTALKYMHTKATELSKKQQENTKEHVHGEHCNHGNHGPSPAPSMMSMQPVPQQTVQPSSSSTTQLSKSKKKRTKLKAKLDAAKRELANKEVPK